MNLAKFVKECVGVCWEGCNMDGGDIEALAVECGIIVPVKFDPNIHKDHSGYSEEGDPWLEYTDEFKAALAVEQQFQADARR